MRQTIKNIITEETKIIGSIINILNKYFDKTITYYDNYYEYDDDLNIDVKIKYTLSDKTRIWKTEGTKFKYEGTIYFDILEIIGDINEEYGQPVNIRYMDGIPERIWEDLTSDIDDKLKPIIGNIVDYDIDFNSKPLRETKQPN